MNVYEVAYCVGGTHHYISQIITENLRKIPDILEDFYEGAGIVSWKILKVSIFQKVGILNAISVERDTYDLLMKCDEVGGDNK